MLQRGLVTSAEIFLNVASDGRDGAVPLSLIGPSLHEGGGKEERVPSGGGVKPWGRRGSNGSAVGWGNGCGVRVAGVGRGSTITLCLHHPAA